MQFSQICNILCCFLSAAQCRAKEEDTHQLANEGCRYLARQCSDPSAVEALAKHFFAVINGQFLFAIGKN